MLFDATLTRVVVDTLKEHYAHKPIPPLVCDPVCVATSGHSLLNPDAIDVMITDLFPLATLITPNKAEAELLLSHCRSEPYPVIQNLDEMLVASKACLDLGPSAVLLKGGHLAVTFAEVRDLSNRHKEITVLQDGPLGDNMEILHIGKDIANMDIVVDILYERGYKNVVLFVRPRINSTSTHGTGCTLSAAIASGLANGLVRTSLLSTLSHCNLIICQLPTQSERPLCTRM